MKLIDKQNRDILTEGRTYQMGFAFCKRVEKDVFETVHPVSPCKDYLNDVVIAEQLGISVGVYGLDYKGSKEVFSNNCGYIFFKICPQRGGKCWGNDGLKKDTENLTNNIANVQKFINIFEEKLNIKSKSIIKPIADGFIIKFSLDWTKGVYAISMFSLLLRLSQWYDGTDVITYLEKYNNPLDVYLLKDVFPKIKKVLEIGLLQEKIEVYRNCDAYNIHNGGICSLNVDNLIANETSNTECIL